MSDLIKYFKDIDPVFMWLFGIVIVVLPILKFCLGHLTQKHTIKQKNLELLLSAYKAESMTKCEEFVVEHIISGIYKRRISFPIIRALLCSSSPIDSFELYKQAKYYVKLTTHAKPFRLKRKFSVLKIFGRKLCYWVSLRELGYYVISMLSSFILFAFGHYLLNGLSGKTFENIPLLILPLFVFLTALILASIGFHFLRTQGGIGSVKPFLRLQLTDSSRKLPNA